MRDYSIVVDEPVGATIYIDDVEIGVVPLGFTKVSGTHTITLSRSGYKTKSYTIDVDSEQTHVNYSFPELVKYDSYEGD